jgi:hypothetical protein
VGGLYAALLRRERDHQLDHERFVEKHPQYHNTHDKQLLDDLELGRPVILQGRRLKGWGIPRVPLQRSDAFQWFKVSHNDSVVPAQSPEDRSVS